MEARFGMTTLCYGLLFVFWCEAAQPTPPITVCPPVAAWSQGYQADLAEEAKRLPKGALREALREHLRLREQLRRCRNR
jgi:hypothetical protein